jgi:hypothetical protein
MLSKLKSFYGSCKSKLISFWNGLDSKTRRGIEIGVKCAGLFLAFLLFICFISLIN